MSTIQDARSLLTEAEKGLRELMQRDIREQRYMELAEVARMADGVARLVRGERPPATVAIASPPAPRTARVTKTTKASRKKYPKFHREGDKLVKTGWSKRAGEEYQHRAPRDVVMAFARSLTSRVEPGQTFVMEDLLPVPDDAGAELPAYQVYLALAWLRSTGAIEKKGRDGYVLRRHGLMNGAMQQFWETLPQHAA